MLNLVDSIEFSHLIWVIPVVQLIHELEEWNILKWYKENYVDLPDSTNLSIRVWILFFSLFVYVWTTLCFFTPNRVISAILVSLLIMITTQNGLQHLYWLFYFKKYAPGVVSFVILLIPLNTYVVYRILKQEFLPFWLLIIIMALMIPGLIETIRARNRMTKIVRVVVHEYPIKLIRTFSD